MPIIEHSLYGQTSTRHVPINDLTCLLIDNAIGIAIKNRVTNTGQALNIIWWKEMNFNKKKGFKR